MPARRSVAVFLVVLVAVSVLYKTAHERDYTRDFDVYRTGAVRALAGEPIFQVDDGAYQFKYWPVFAVLMTPFALIPADAGKIVWLVLEVALFSLSLRLSMRALPGRRLSLSVLAGWTVFLTLRFIVRELVNGQANVLLGALVVLAYVAYEQRHPWRVGVLVGLAAFVKPYALVLLPWVAVTEGIGGLAALAMTLVAGLVLPAVLYGWQGNLDQLAGWYRTVSATTSETLTVRENISLASAWAKWIGPGEVATALTLVSIAALFSLAVWVWWRGRRLTGAAYLDLSFLLWIVPLVSPQGWDYLLIIALPAVVCLADRFRDVSGRWKAVTAAGFVLVSVTVYDLLGRRLYFVLGDHAAFTIGALLLVAALAHVRHRALA